MKKNTLLPGLLALLLTFGLILTSCDKDALLSDEAKIISVTSVSNFNSAGGGDGSSQDKATLYTGTVTINTGNTSETFTPIKVSKGATSKIYEGGVWAPVSLPISIKSDETKTLNVVVTAEDGTTKKYYSLIVTAQ